MTRGDARSDLNLRGVERRDEAEGQERLRLLTDAGAVECRWHPAPAGDAAVLWVFGAGGGLGGPAGGHCQLARSRSVFDRAAVLRERSRRHLHARLLPPHPEGLVAGATVLSGGHQVPPRAEVAVDHGVR